MNAQLDMFGTGETVPKEKSRRRPTSAIAAVDVTMLTHVEMADALEATGDYRILRRLAKPAPANQLAPGFGRIGVVVDTETTGLKQAEDEVIELGAVAFQYSDDGRVGDIIGVFGAFQAPSKPIPPEITRLTGIMDEMVRGQSIPMSELEAFLAPADLIIAHNAAFDRPFCERLNPLFADKAWACSNNEIDWRARGFEGTKLGYLMNQSGLFHDGHRAVDDCFALLEVLRQPKGGERAPFAELLESSRLERVRVWAEYSPFDKKDVLKARGYKWSSGEDQQPKAWWTEVDAGMLETEKAYLEAEIYGRSDFTLTTKHLTAVSRFKR
ncbi:3'-5' exonuclease [Asticcacaulis sp.]|uniref:3'-5' exonuclease n=1 Tax=Asticcacaulis sp. TaxID=1872648 RepID=UPI003F7BBC5A